MSAPGSAPIEVLEFYDQPLLYTTLGNDKELLLEVYCNSSNVSESWMAVEVTPEEVALAEKNVSVLRSLFTRRENLLRITTVFRDKPEKFVRHTVPFWVVNPDWFPEI